MRGLPLGLVLSIVTAAALVLWVLTSFLTASYIGDSVTLVSLALDSFVVLYRAALAGAALAGLLGTVVWLLYGSRPGRALGLDQARRVWITLWFIELCAASGVVVGMVVRMIVETLSPGNLAFLFVMMSLHTWVFFWICSLLFSPRTVERLPWLARRLP